MDTILVWFSDDRVKLLVFIWIIVLGVGILFYSGSESLSRNNALKKIGIDIGGETSKKKSKIESLSSWFGQLFSVSDRDIENKFISAGIYNSRLYKWLLPIKYTALAIGSVLIYLYTSTQHMEITSTVAGISVWVVIVVIGPDLYLELRKKKLHRKLSERLPYLLDLMGVCVRTGMTIEASVAYLAHEMEGFDKDIAHMLHKTNERAKLVGLESALEELYVRVPTNEVRSFVMTLNQSLQYGSSIYEVLSNLAKDIREVHMLELEEKIGKLSAKMSVPLILFIMFPIVILITAPGIMRLLGGLG